MIMCQKSMMQLIRAILGPCLGSCEDMIIQILSLVGPIDCISEM